MPPIPCAHCGVNFMRQNLDYDAPKLCNNCSLREERRTTKKEDKMTTIDILIKCPRQDQIDIEEYCINEGMDFTQYFMSLHHTFRDKTDAFASDAPKPKSTCHVEKCYGDEEDDEKIPKKKAKSKK